MAHAANMSDFAMRDPRVQSSFNRGAQRGGMMSAIPGMLSPKRLGTALKRTGSNAKEAVRRGRDRIGDRVNGHLDRAMDHADPVGVPSEGAQEQYARSQAQSLSQAPPLSIPRGGEKEKEGSKQDAEEPDAVAQDADEQEQGRKSPRERAQEQAQQLKDRMNMARRARQMKKGGEALAKGMQQSTQKIGKAVMNNGGRYLVTAIGGTFACVILFILLPVIVLLLDIWVFIFLIIGKMLPLDPKLVDKWKPTAFDIAVIVLINIVFFSISAVIFYFVALIAQFMQASWWEKVKMIWGAVTEVIWIMLKGAVT